MTQYTELKRLADNYASLIDSEDRDSELEARDIFQDAARVDVIQGLIGRLEVSESMEGLYTSTVTVERAELEQAKRELSQLKADNEFARMRVKELDLLFGRYILAMRAAVIEEEHGLGAEGAMMWIYNSLVGPGELPPESETIAQAYFDREIVAIDNGMQEVLAFHDERQAAKLVQP